MALMEKQKESESFKLKTKIKFDDDDSVVQINNQDEDSKQTAETGNKISINIDQLRESLKMNKTVQKRQNELVHSLMKKK